MRLLPSVVVLFALFGCSVAASDKDYLETSRMLPELAKRIPQARETEYLFPRLIAELGETGGEFSQRRRLAQLSSELCSWSDDSRDCGISNSGILSLLDSADNAVAAYNSRLIECFLQNDADSCDDRSCSWIAGLGCSVPHEDYRELHSARCLQAVDHIIDVRAGNLECRPKATELDCSASDQCSWSSTGCSFDRWKYFHGIPSNGSFPEGFQEVLGTRSDQLIDDMGTAIDSGDILQFSDLLNWTPPAFDCPDDAEQVICDYVEAFVPYLVSGLYCPLEYDEVFEIPSCDRDPLCVAGTSTTRFCEVNEVVLVLAVQQGETAFANSIEDREARAYMLQNAQCAGVYNEEDCDDAENCVWLDESSSCRVTDKWIAQEIDRLVPDSRDPACAYFKLDTGTGCITEDDPDTCREDSACFYSTSSESCGVGIRGQVRYALDVSGLSDDYDRATEACGDAENELACNAVIIPTDPAAAIPPEPPASSTAPAMAPESEEAMESIIEQELEEIGGDYGTDDAEGDDEDEESPSFLSSVANQTSTGNSSSAATGSLFGDLFGK